VRRLPRRSLAAACFALVLLAGCGDDNGSAATTTTTAATPTTTGAAGTTSRAPGDTAATTAPTATAAPTTTAPANPVFEITYTGGRLTGGGRKQVKRGQQVTLRVTSDVADEVHVHGFDKKLDLVAGQPGELTFTADASGVFEVELEKKHLQLIELEVR
jgi:ABC-type phosphate transport system substrate-binding protein